MYDTFYENISHNDSVSIACTVSHPSLTIALHGSDVVVFDVEVDVSDVS